MKMAVSSIQFSPSLGNIENNLDRISALVARAKKDGARLVVLPEVCDIGYHLDTISRLSEAFPNRSTRRLSSIAKDNDVIMVAGLAERRGDGLYNAAVVLSPEGKIVNKYYKTHLCPFPSLNEPEVFKAGSAIGVTEVEGIKLGITICYDIRFPEIYRKLALGGAQIIVHPAAFPRGRIDQLEVCLRARAIENQLFAVMANNCGTIGGAEFGGRSMIIGPAGDIKAKAPETEETVITAALDLSEMETLRKEKPVLSKRRPELY